MARCLTPLCVLLFLVTVAIPCGYATGPVEGGWQAGVGRQVITPPSPMWMSGYASRTGPAEGKLHDLWAKAVVLQDPAGERLVLVSLDLVGIGRDVSMPACARLQKQFGLQRAQIALCTSHTHTGPVVGKNLGSMYFLDESSQKQVEEQTERIIDGIATAVGTAIKDLQPAVLSYGMGEATFAVNRRNNREADVPKLREAGELQGPVDHSAPVLAVHDSAGKMKAVAFGYACHATVLSLNQWSGDWPGYAQIAIEEQHPGTVALFMAGCGADQNPLPRRTVELAEGYGQQMAQAVDQVLSSDMEPVTGGLKSAYREIDLAYGELPSREQVEKDLESSNKYIVGRARTLLPQFNDAGALAPAYPYPVQVWAIGDQARAVILGGEVVVDYSLRLRSEFPDHDLWVAGYSNDVMAYIPSLRVLKEGGYEGATSMIYYGLPTVWSENVEEHIVKTVHELVETVNH